MYVRSVIGVVAQVPSLLSFEGMQNVWSRTSRVVFRAVPWRGISYGFLSSSASLTFPQVWPAAARGRQSAKAAVNSQAACLISSPPFEFADGPRFGGFAGGLKELLEVRPFRRKGQGPRPRFPRAAPPGRDRRAPTPLRRRRGTRRRGVPAAPRAGPGPGSRRARVGSGRARRTPRGWPASPRSAGRDRPGG